MSHLRHNNCKHNEFIRRERKMCTFFFKIEFDFQNDSHHLKQISVHIKMQVKLSKNLVKTYSNLKK
jgi:hypothetical protein